MVKIVSMAFAIQGLWIGAAVAADPDVSGSSALALSSLIGRSEPSLSPAAKRLLAADLEGRPAAPAGVRPIAIRAASVRCRSSDVDISHHDCTLDFGRAKRRISGRLAHELYATLIEAGVRTEGAAGSIFAAVSRLSCRVDQRQVAARGGGGATCRFAPFR